MYHRMHKLLFRCVSVALKLAESSTSALHTPIQAAGGGDKCGADMTSPGMSGKCQRSLNTNQSFFNNVPPAVDLICSMNQLTG
jgi:hypothetical protein